SALWGPDAFSGIINLVTKKGEQLQGVSVSAETGPYDTRRTALQAGWNARGWDAVLFGSVSHSEDFEHDIPGRPQRKDDRFREFYGKVSYKDFFEISGRHSSARNNYTVPEFLLEGSDQKPFSFLQASLHKPFEQSSLSFQGWYQYFESTDKYGYYDNPVNYLVRQDQTNRQYGLELKYDRTLFSNNFATL
ncbi:MAG: hypothetical protein GY868_21525, partial [Deltaproteobacteria bacterium]|nr:hypothetical protein [Deltaproteobacteria bacterium]